MINIGIRCIPTTMTAACVAVSVFVGGANVAAAQERLTLPEEYLLIAGGWHLNVRCAFLDELRQREFRSNLLRLDEIARSVLEAPYVKMLRETARNAAYDPSRGDCSEDDKAVVMESMTMAQSFAEATNDPKPVLAANEPIPET